MCCFDSIRLISIRRLPCRKGKIEQEPIEIIRRNKPSFQFLRKLDPDPLSERNGFERFAIDDMAVVAKELFQLFDLLGRESLDRAPAANPPSRSIVEHGYARAARH